MKRFLLILLFGFQFMTAQDTISTSKLLHRKNEFRIDLLSLVASSKLNATYERFLNNRFSVGVTGNYTDSNKINAKFDSGNRNVNPKYEIMPFVRYNLSKGISSFYFAEIFASANGGNFRETVRLTNQNNNDYYTIQKTTYSDLGLGAGVGYKFYIKDRLGIEFLVGFGTNLLNRDKSPDVLSRVGLNIGYRF